MMLAPDFSRRPQPQIGKTRLVLPAWPFAAGAITLPPLSYWFWRSVYDAWVWLGVPELGAGMMITFCVLGYIATLIVYVAGKFVTEDLRIVVWARWPFREPHP